MLSRTFNKRRLEELELKYDDFINIDNVDKVGFLTIAKTFRKEPYSDKQTYLTHLVNKWWNSVDFDIKNYKTMLKMIKRFKIELFEEDLDKIQIYEEVLFSGQRKFKKIPVNYPLDKDEFAYIKYTEMSISEFKGNKFGKPKKGEIIFTNKSIYHAGKEKTTIKWSSINKYAFTDRGFVMNLGKRKYIISMYDNKVIETLLRNFFKHKINSMITKESKQWKF